MKEKPEPSPAERRRDLAEWLATSLAKIEQVDIPAQAPKPLAALVMEWESWQAIFFAKLDECGLSRAWVEQWLDPSKLYASRDEERAILFGGRKLIAKVTLGYGYLPDVEIERLSKSFEQRIERAISHHRISNGRAVQATLADIPSFEPRRSDHPIRRLA